MSDKYSSHYDPHSVKDLAFSILEKNGRSPNGQDWGVEDLCILFDWMHEHIRYEKDRSHYGQNDYIATPSETLKAGCGDCEDHALLYGSMCMAIGVDVRMAIVPAHAFTEICLGKATDLNMKQVVNTIQRYLKSKSRALGAKPGQIPFCQGEICDGWTRLPDGSYTSQPSHHFHSRNFNGVQWLKEDGKIYLPVDDCFAMMYIGDCKRLSKFRAAGKTRMWAEVAYQYPPAQTKHAGSHPTRPAERPRRRSDPSTPVVRPRPRRGNSHLAPLALLLVLTSGLGWWFDRIPLAVDAAAGLIVAWYAWRGYEVGFFEQVGRIASWVVPILGAMWALEPLDKLYGEYVGVEIPFRRYVLYGLVFAALFALLRMVLRKVADGHNSSVLDGLMGTVTGGLMGTAAVYVIVLGSLVGARALDWSPPVAGSYTVAFTQTFNVLEEGRLDVVQTMIDEVGGEESTGTHGAPR